MYGSHEPMLLDRSLSCLLGKYMPRPKSLFIVRTSQAFHAFSSIKSQTGFWEADGTGSMHVSHALLDRSHALLQDTYRTSHIKNMELQILEIHTPSMK